MAKNEMFRVALFGGFNKDDVMEHIKTLENEIDAIKVLHQKEKNDLVRKLEEQGEGTQIGDEQTLQLKEELAQKINELQGAREELAKKDSELTDMRQEIIQKESELKATQNEPERDDNELKTAQDELARIRHELEKKEEELSAEERELSKRNDELKTAQDELSRVQRELEKREEELRDVRYELIQKNEEEKNSRETFAHRESECAGSTEELKKKEAELLWLQKELEKKDRELRSVQRELTQKSEELKMIQETQDENINELCIRKEEKDIFEYEMISKILDDARKNASMIESEARENAEKIIRKAKIEAESYQNADQILRKAKEEVWECERQMIVQMDVELANKGIQMLAAKYKITHYMSEVQKIQESLLDVYTNMNHMVEQMPVHIEEYWESVNYKLFSEEIKKTEKTRLTTEKFQGEHLEEEKDKVEEEKQ